MPPKVLFESGKVIRRARRRALVRDLVDLTLLGGVDWLFIHWPQSHVPLFDRVESLEILIAANVVVMTMLVVARRWPSWKAKRVAATWSVPERDAFERLNPPRRRRAGSGRE